MPSELNSALSLKDLGAARRNALWFVLPVLLCVAMLIAAIAYRQGAFETFDRVTLVVDSAAGISKGMPVKLKGLVVGTVQDIVPRAGRQANELVMQVELSINRRHTRFIASDAPVSIGQDGLLGQTYLDVGTGTATRAVANGESLQFTRKRSISELAQGLADGATPILRDFASLAKSLDDPKGDARTAMRSFRESAEAVPEVTRKTLKVLTETEATVVQLRKSSSATLQQATQVLSHTERLVTTVEEATPKLIKDTDRILQNAERASASASRIVENSETPVQTILSKGEQGTTGAVDVIEGARSAWPLRAMLPAPRYSSALPELGRAPGVLRPGGDAP